jgi:hypothetical protein
MRSRPETELETRILTLEREPRQWKASYLRLAESYEVLAKEMEALARARAPLGRIYRSRPMRQISSLP